MKNGSSNQSTYIGTKFKSNTYSGVSHRNVQKPSIKSLDGNQTTQNKGGDLLLSVSEAHQKGEVKCVCFSSTLQDMGKSSSIMWAGGTNCQMTLYDQNNLSVIEKKIVFSSSDSLTSLCAVQVSKKNNQKQDLNDCSRLVSSAIWSGFSNGRLAVWNARDFTKKFDVVGHSGSVNSIVQVGHCVWTGSEDCTIRIWDSQTCQVKKKLINEIEKNAIPVRCILAVPNFSQIWSSGNSSVILIRDPRTSSMIGTINIRSKNTSPSDGEKNILGLAYSNNYVFAASDKCVTVIDVKSKTLLKEIKVHQKPIMSITSTEKQVWTTAMDKIVIMDSESLKTIKNISAKKEYVYFVESAPGEKVIGVCSDKKIRVWGSEGEKKLELNLIQEEEQDSVEYMFETNGKVNFTELETIGYEEGTEEVSVREAQKEIILLRNQLNEQTAKINKLKQKIKAKRQKIEERGAQMKGIITNYNTLQHELHRMRVEKEFLEDKVKEFREELKTKKPENSMVNSGMELSEASLETNAPLRDKSITPQVSEEAKQNIYDLNQEILSAQKDMQLLLSDLQNVCKENECLQGDLVEKTLEVETLKHVIHTIDVNSTFMMTGAHKGGELEEEQSPQEMDKSSKQYRLRLQALTQKVIEFGKESQVLQQKLNTHQQSNMDIMKENSELKQKLLAAHEIVLMICSFLRIDLGTTSSASPHPTNSEDQTPCDMNLNSNSVSTSVSNLPILDMLQLVFRKISQK